MGVINFPCRADVVKQYKTTKRTIKGLVGYKIRKVVEDAMHNEKIVSITILKR